MVPSKDNKFFFLLLAFIIVRAIGADAIGQTHRAGIVVDKNKYARVPLARPLMRGGEIAEIPRRYSLKQFAPTPGNQEEYATSPAWATTYSALTCMTAVLAGVTGRAAIDSLSFSPAFTYLCSRPESDGECQTPISIEDAFDVIQQRGSLSLREFQYECRGRITENDSMRALDRKITGYRKLFEDGTTEKSEPVRKSVASGKAVVVGLYVAASIDDAKELWMPAQEEYTMLTMAQAMTVVAYDDSKYGGSFELMNSWGTGWGNEGFLWITYADFNHFCASAFEMLLDKEVSKTNTVSLRLIQDSNEPIKMANMGGFFRTGEAFPSGTRFRVDLTVEKQCFLFAFATDSTSMIPQQLFPRRNAAGSMLAESDTKISIPGPTALSFSRLDSVTGMDYYCILVSNSPIDGDKLLETFRSATGGFHARLHLLFEQIESLNTRADRMIDLLVTGNETFLPIVIEMRHY
ncbi:MAG: C1 family peptidase [Ignavibacteriae bacterium]|nr:C1 family peptidase [Ignavibacteriota bacterium]